MDLSYPDLVRRLYDLERLAEPPLPGEQGGAMTSGNELSRYDPVTDTYENWHSLDGKNEAHIRKEGEWIVAFESEGPGVIWRVWSAMPSAGHIQVFIDDDPEPVIDTPFVDFFGKFNEVLPSIFADVPMNFPDIAPTLSRGRNRFIPIPFNRSCKVRLAPGWGSFYHFTYTRFPKGTGLPRFEETIDRAACIALSTADRHLAERGWTLPRSADDTVERVTVTVPPGEARSVATLTGNRAIAGMRVQLDLPAAPLDVPVLRELALQITWDDDAQPSVWAPLGDLFGTVPGVNYYRSLPQGATDGGLYSHWFMPFAERADIEIINDGSAPRTLTFVICHRPLERSAHELLRFHAKWHGDAFLERPRNEGRPLDWPLLVVEGQGRFCGISLHVLNSWTPPEQPADTWWYGSWFEKSIDWWWGEGREKFFVDRERFPSTIGTGSEDYVGYAWSAEPPFRSFDSAYANQPATPIDGNGHTVVSRFHIADDIPFHTAFEGYIEKLTENTWGDGFPCLYDVVAYWYQRPGGLDPYGVVPMSDRGVGEAIAP
jgi:hypothetical protein